MKGVLDTPRDICRFPWPASWACRATAALYDAGVLWRYPADRSGDLAKMALADKAYWFAKAARPIERAVRGAGLEAHFARQDAHRWELPPWFVPTARATVSAAGDLMNHPYLERSEESLFPEVREQIFGADLPMANLEAMLLESAGPELRTDGKGAPPLHFTPRALEVVTRGRDRSFGFLATACNHSLDFGALGVDVTVRRLKSLGIASHGLNEAEAHAERAEVVERNGVRIGLIAWTFGLNGHRPPEGRPRIVNQSRLNSGPLGAELGLLETQLLWCRREQVDFVIAHLHWGMEFERYPRPEQLALAHHLAELGVDAIIGHHPHVVQPVEFHRVQRDPDRIVPIHYSLGNLTTPFEVEFLAQSAVAQLALAKGRCRDGTVRTYVASSRLDLVEQVVDHRSRTISLRPASE